MTPEEMLAYCLAKPGAWPDNPWGHEYPVVKVHDKIFAFIGGDGVGVKSGPTREVLSVDRGLAREEVQTGGLRRLTWEPDHGTDAPTQHG